MLKFRFGLIVIRGSRKIVRNKELKMRTFRTVKAPNTGIAAYLFRASNTTSTGKIRTEGAGDTAVLAAVHVAR